MEMDPILKSGTLSMSLNRMQQDFTTIPSPLPILGYYQPHYWSSQLALCSEWCGQGQLQYYYTRSSAASQLVVMQ